MNLPYENKCTNKYYRFSSSALYCITASVRWNFADIQNFRVEINVIKTRAF